MKPSRAVLGAEKFSAVRCVIVGAATSHNIGYFLYRDKVDVTMMPGVSLERIDENMSLRETIADYFVKAKSTGDTRINPPTVGEVLKGQEIVGYPVADRKMGVGVWDRTGTGDASRISLERVIDSAERENIAFPLCPVPVRLRG